MWQCQETLILRATDIPMMVPPRQSMTLKKNYVEAAKYLLFWIMVTVSSEKVENVVNPPQKPAMPEN